MTSLNHWANKDVWKEAQKQLNHKGLQRLNKDGTLSDDKYERLSAEYERLRYEHRGLLAKAKRLEDENNHLKMNVANLEGIIKSQKKRSVIKKILDLEIL